MAAWAVVALRPGVDPPRWEFAVQIAGTALFVVASALQVLTRLVQFGNYQRQATDRVDELETYRRTRLQAVG